MIQPGVQFISSGGARGQRGATGATGPAGRDGRPGLDGAMGKSGLDGKSASGFVWRGLFDVDTIYAAGDIVYFGGSSFISLIDNNTFSPYDRTSEAWDIVALKGERGGSGGPGLSVVGPTGPTGSGGGTGGTDLAMVRKLISIGF